MPETQNIRRDFSGGSEEPRQNQRSVRRMLSRAGIQSLVALVLVGCLSRIQLDVDPTSGRIVVSGQVSTIADQNRVQLGTTFGPNRLPEPISNALVIVYDNFGTGVAWPEDPNKPGVYRQENYVAVPGGEYFVEVVLPDDRTFRSLPERLPEPVADVDVYYTIEEDRFTDREGTVGMHPFVKVYTNNLLPESPAFIRWSVEECYVVRPTDFHDPFGNVPPPCYVLTDPDPQRIVLYNGLEQSPGRMDNLLVSSRLLDRSFYDRHYFSVYQSSLTREAFDYWRKVDVVSNRVGSIFDTPPAIITGNIYDVNNPESTALGYFQAVNQTLDRFFLLPSDIPIPISYKDCVYQPGRPFEDYAPECLNCLSLRNSSFVRPEWF